ncbi:MAG: hypothetical protein J6X28_00060 [Bacilli bacterium]|nr:hypothetical protein [Bacilli bacterium]
MKAYKVRLFEIPNGMKHFVEVDRIIVLKKLFSVKEALTGYSQINVVEKNLVKLRPFPHVKEDFLPLPKRTANGSQLFVIQEEMGPYSVAKEEDIDLYVTSYDSSRWKALHDEIRICEERQSQK